MIFGNHSEIRNKAMYGIVISINVDDQYVSWNIVVIVMMK